MNQLNPLGPLMEMLKRVEREACSYAEPGELSDQDRDAEWEAQVLVLPAIARLREALVEAIPRSSIMGEQLQELLDALDDNAPSELAWDEKIAEAMQ